MKNKQHEYILKAFMESPIPRALKREAQNLISLDSVIGGYCTQITKGAGKVVLTMNPIISAEEKNSFSNIINAVSAEEKEELIVYYRLAVLAESIIIKYT